MTSSVKGPGGPSGIASPEIGLPSKSEGVSSFREVQAEARAVATEAAEVKDPVALALMSGELDPAGAVEALLERALAGGAAAGLTASGREALRAHLLSALETDPALRALVRDLSSEQG